MIRIVVAAVWLLAGLSLCSAEEPIIGADWTMETGAATGPPVPLPSAAAAQSVLVTVGGQVLLIDPSGRQTAAMKLDRPAAAEAVAGVLWKDHRTGIIAVDLWGSVYCFNLQGQRLWKYSRESNMGSYRLPVLADLDGDGAPEILLTDSLGYLIVLDTNGHLKLEVRATHYRLSPPVAGDVDGDGKPEILFATEDRELISINHRGEVLWTRQLAGRFGRSMPLVADLNGDGRYQLLIPSSYVQFKPGIWALDARTGGQLWKADSQLQTYQSTAIADLDGDGNNEILFGDKNTRVYCVNTQGKQLWSTQLDGRGIFFAPAVADLEGNRQATIFQVVRDAGENGKSLYALNARGEILQSVALPGGGANSPSLVRFQGQAEVKLLVNTRGGKLACYRLSQSPGRARMLWASVRGSGDGSGFFASAKASRQTAARPAPLPAAERREAVEGVNDVPTGALPQGAVASLRTVAPDGTVQARIIRNDADAFRVNGNFTAAAPGRYKVSLTVLEANGNRVTARREFDYALAPAFAAIRRRQARFESQARSLGAKLGSRADLRDWAIAETRALLSFAESTRTASAFNDLRAAHRYYTSLLERLAADPPVADAVVYAIADPWTELDAAAFLKSSPPPPNRIAVRMVGNEYESAAFTLTNLQTRTASFRIAVDAIGSVPSPKVVAVREVPLVTNAYPRQPAEDVLPKLGEGQLIRLGPLETRKVWLTICSRELAAGDHHTPIRIGDLASPREPLQAGLDIHVANVRLPDKRSYREQNWLYFPGGQPDNDLENSTYVDALDHGINVFNLSPITLRVDTEGNVQSAALAAHDRMIAKLRGHVLFLIMGSVNVEWPKGYQPAPALEEKTYGRAIRWYSAHMKRLGLNYSDYALYIQDEPGLMGYDKNYQRWMTNLKRIKAADPEIHLYADPAGGAKPEILKPVAHLLSIIQPDLHLIREDPAGMKSIAASAQYWQYEAPADQRHLDPLGFYRMKPWVSYQMGMTGGGYWVYQSTPFWFLDPNLGTEYGSVYPTASGPVTTKRWEASRDGIEDYELLTMLHNRAANSPEAQKLLEDAVAFVTAGQQNVSDISRQLRSYTPDFKTWMEYRERIVTMLERLSQ
ncbi:MAG: PQQ-binding-like beta-propeller repeat protein [Bryobacterales bacterium]|nr:PQQ-binding-like beta-propeller repeat protein [Bryobacterales bacterium]